MTIDEARRILTAEVYYTVIESNADDKTICFKINGRLISGDEYDLLVEHLK